MTGTDPTASGGLALTDVTVRYGDVVALERATLAVGAGRVCGLVGTNGSGKSTLLKALLGLVRPDSGTVTVAGGPPHGARRRALVAYVPQAEQVDVTFPLDVRGVVEQGRYGHLGPARRLRPADHDAVAAALERVGLTALAHRTVGALSGGQRKRAFVARALAQEARVLLLDEPFAGVDRPSQDTISEVLRELADGGACVLVATHDLVGLPELADEAALLAAGRVLVHDTPAVVLQPETLALGLGLGRRDGRRDAPEER